MRTLDKSSKSSNQANPDSDNRTPKLRFKGFDKNWNKVKLGDIGLTNGGLTYSPTDLVEDESKGTLVLRSSNIQNEMISFHDNVYVSCSISEKDLVKENDILICVRNGSKNLIGKSIIIKKEHVGYAFGAFMAIYRSESNLFVYHFFKSNNFRKQVHEHLGATINQITGKSLNSFRLSIPSLPEQQKIASFLSAVDEKIQQLTRKKEALERYKKGVMQQLFSGKLRFKDENGKAFPKWDWLHGNELFDSISDKNHNSDLPILAITQDMGAVPRDMINYQMTVTDSSIASYKVVQKGDFIISLRTFQGGIEYSNYKGICSPAYNILRPSSDNVHREFYKYYLKTSIYIKQLQKNLEGIRDGKMISFKYFSEIKLPYPSKNEQQKIASYLSGIDTKLERVSSQITEAQTFKKGLLQQLFV